MNMSFIGDGWCDWNTHGGDKIFDVASHAPTTASSEYNNAACQWDGGDCCVETCVGSKQWHPEKDEVGTARNRTYACGEYDHEAPNDRPYFCLDPKHTRSRAVVRVSTPTNRVGGHFQVISILVCSEIAKYRRLLPLSSSPSRCFGYCV